MALLFDIVSHNVFVFVKRNAWYFFRLGKEVEVITGLDKKIEGEGSVKGFVLDLNLLKI